MNSFMNSIKTAATGAVTEDKTTNTDQTSNTGLLSSAKLVAEAAQLAANNQTDQIDKPKVASAADDLLDSVKQYGKFDESQGVGQYLKQADEYLHQYEKSSGVAGTTTPPAEAPLMEEKKAEIPAPVEEKKAEIPAPVEEKKAEVPVPVEEEKAEAPPPAVEEKGGNDEFESTVGAGDALKAAGSFFK